MATTSVRPLLAIAAVVASFIAADLLTASPASAARLCTPEDLRKGLCDSQVSGSTDGTSVVLDGSQTSPGSTAGGNDGTGGGPSAPPIMIDQSLIHPCRLGVVDDSICEAVRGADEPISIRDIASFIPTPGRQLMEPDGWTVAGLDTNFYAVTEPHVVPGTLLGRAADVRFTPVAFHWAYGDGTALTLPTKGGTWTELGVEEFAPTPTSHVYEQLGDYTITLSISFAAEYRFDGGGWTPVVGQLTLPANELYLRVGTAKTVLVDRDCLTNPAGPGC